MVMFSASEDNKIMTAYVAVAATRAAPPSQPEGD
jgi:hypothetical protein